MTSCPVPARRYDHVVLGHGSGGRLSAELLEDVFLPCLGNEILSRLEDQATVAAPAPGERLAFTTDAFVVRPLFFPGGDIGALAVHGTVNDLAVGGARPVALSAAFVLEEGLPIADLVRIVRSMTDACREAGVHVVTGDTKVVDRGKGDGVFITTSGIGFVPAGRSLSIAGARPGDRVLVSGPIGDHGVAILSVREGLSFDTELQSDTAPLHDLAAAMLLACPEIRCMRDVTRGGLATVLDEVARASGVGIRLDERAVPVRDEVRSACELLGLDPLHVACEGRLVALAPASVAERLLAVMRAHPRGRRAAVIGEASERDAGRVLLRTTLGGVRLLGPLLGEQLPRIC